MKEFSELYTLLDQTTKTTAKVAALSDYFAEAQPADAAWAVFFLSGQKLKRLIPTKLLRQWSAEAAGIEDWMFDECYDIVGDLAEVMALILPAATETSNLSLEYWVSQRLNSLRELSELAQREAVRKYWRELSKSECFVFHKLITGSFRVGVSKKLVVRGLASQSGIDAEVIAHRLMGNWQPTEENFLALLDPNTQDTEVSRPYPFYLAHPLEIDPSELGSVEQWQVEWKWDGIRAQLIRRQEQSFIWSRGEELMTDRFPELIEVAKELPDGIVIDGEIVGWKDGCVLPFHEMQRRIGRKKLGRKILDDVPVSMLAFDLLELDGKDVREQGMDWRRKKLVDVVGNSPAIRVCETLLAKGWDEFAELRRRSREYQTEGLMLKRRSGPYRVGRPKGDWWKWKIEPYTVDAVLIYAQRGHGRRASLYSDYTFAVWDGDQLVTFAKAYSGLNDAEIRKVDRFVRKNTLERFGPVRSVTPQLVFELAFEDIQPSRRHKSGIAVRFPRISRWREDLQIKDADTLELIKSMMTASRLGTKATVE